jgi:hypothetical protein
MSQYKINRVTASKSYSNVKPDWLSSKPLFIDNYPWYQSGNKQNTQIKLCANQDVLFIQVVADDQYSFAKQTELNHMLVCEDSCVEFFFSPSGKLGSSYVNLEVNCCGTMHIAYGPNRNNRQYINKDIANSIQCKTSISSLEKKETNEDKRWTVDISLPFSAIEQLTGEKINTTRWFANFYRCGGRIDPQYAAWQNIPTAAPDFHRPECFGELIFI